MSKPAIRVLSAHVANKIAAGEVVERPASAVRELVENAFDSGADRVDVEIVSGGKKLISVADNGCGMGRDDAVLALERHATSKISDVDDIEHISTLGFRGEAMPAIASVSRFRLMTRQKGNEVGAEVRVSGGKMYEVDDAGCPEGTTVEVRDLFFNVPARKKFLRTHQTEMGHVRDAFITEALSHPATSMSLKVDGANQYTLPASDSVEDRIRDIFGKDHLASMVAVESDNSRVKVTGMIGLPNLSRPDRKEQYFFVNGRPTSAAVLNHCLREAYHTLMPHGRQPVAFVFIELDPAQVDVNVHPAKKEVRFRHSSDVRDAVIDALRGALKKGLPISGADEGRVGDEPPAQPEQQVQFKIADLPQIRAFKYPSMPKDDDEGRSSLPAVSPLLSMPRGRTTTQEPFTRRSPWSWCRVLGQLADLYVILETDDGYVIMDPHAAHERVLFERFMRQFLDNKVQVQNLLLPVTVEMAPADAAAVKKHIKVFKQMGFGISEFGDSAFVLDAVPAGFGDMSPNEFLLQALSDLEAGGARRSKGKWREESIAQAACKTAVKAKDKLSLEETQKLVIDLANAEMPYTCPHGRPTLIYTPIRELNRRFGRE